MKVIIIVALTCKVAVDGTRFWDMLQKRKTREFEAKEELRMADAKARHVRNKFEHESIREI